MIYVPFDLTYKKLPNGRYAYYPFSPMWGWAYNVSDHERERLTKIDQQQMVLAGGLVIGLATFIFWQSLAAFLIYSFFSLVILKITGKQRKKAVLGGRRLERCAPALSYREYWYQYASRMSGRDIFAILRAFMVIALVGGSMQYYGVQSSQAAYIFTGGLFLLIAVFGLAFGTYCASVRMRQVRSNKASM